MADGAGLRRAVWAARPPRRKTRPPAVARRERGSVVTASRSRAPRREIGMAVETARRQTQETIRESMFARTNEIGCVEGTFGGCALR
jgi:hypothetical protein